LVRGIGKVWVNLTGILGLGTLGAGTQGLGFDCAGPAMTQVFQWHDLAQVTGDATLLRAALATPGLPFRIGGAGPLPTLPAMFETLTSGSSGTPRRILRSMSSWTQSFTLHSDLFGIGPGCHVAVLGDLHQSLSLYGALEALHLGAHLHLLGGLRPDRQRRALGGVHVIYATPTQLRLLLDASGPDLPDLSLVLVGGSKLDGALRKGLAQITAARVKEFYGAAEASFVTLSGDDLPQASVGAAYPGVEIQIRAGMVWVRSPYLFTRYADDLPGNAQWDADWLTVGEMGWLDAGHLYLSGRAGRMVTVADQNVFPEEIEAIMARYDGVRDIAVVPREDALRGAVMVAFCLGDQRQQDAIIARARAEFGALKAPRAIIWLTDWPRLPSGKTDFRLLEQRARGMK
jgi:long-chain acyl-CoA synthetase